MISSTIKSLPLPLILIVIWVLTLVNGSPANSVGQVRSHGEYAISSQVSKAKRIIDGWEGSTELLQQARALLLEVTKKAPTYAPAYVQLARVAFKSGYMNKKTYKPSSLEHAHGYISKALVLDPNLGDAYLISAYIFAFQQNLDSAKEQMEKAARFHANPTDLLILKAFLANSQQKADEAIVLAKKVVASGSEDHLLRQAYQELSRAYLQKKDYEQVEATYEATLKLYPNSAWEHANFSYFLSWREKHDDAIAHGEAALKLMDFEMGHAVLAEAYQVKGDHLLWTVGDSRRAQQYYRQAIDHNPTNDRAHYGAGMSCRTIAALTGEASSLDHCRASIAKALRLNPSLPHAKLVLDKLPEFKLAMSMPGNTVDERIKRGMAYIKAIAPDEGLKDLRHALSMDPARIEVYKQLDTVLSERHEWDAVIAVWTKLIALQPENGQAYYERGGASFHKGDIPTALKDLEKACNLKYRDSCQLRQRFVHQ